MHVLQLLEGNIHPLVGRTHLHQTNLVLLTVNGDSPIRLRLTKLGGNSSGARLAGHRDGSIGFGGDEPAQHVAPLARCEEFPSQRRLERFHADTYGEKVVELRYPISI